MRDIILSPIIDDIVWSYSNLTCFEDCRYRWFMQYITKTEQEDRFYASFGSFIHKIIEAYYKKSITKEQMKLMFLKGFRTEVTGFRPSEKIVDSYIQKLLSYFENFEEFPYEMVAVEDRIYFNINGNSFVSIVDYIGRDTDGGLVIIDNKSRDLKQRSKRKKPTAYDLILDDMLKQLYLYSAAVKEKYGDFPKKLCFNCFKNGAFIEEKFNPDEYQKTIDWVESVIQEIKNVTMNDFYPDMMFFKCMNICGFSSECCYWQQR